MKDEASPRPWRVERNTQIYGFEGSIASVGGIEGYENAKANAALIIKAVNLHDDLVAALGDIVSVTKDASMFIQAVKAREIAQAMIKKAKED